MRYSEFNRIILTQNSMQHVVHSFARRLILCILSNGREFQRQAGFIIGSGKSSRIVHIHLH